MERVQTRVASTVRREQILSVAAELFAQQGYQGTTTRQIAESAGVSETILFRHFPTKEDLYWGVIDGICKTPQSAACREEKWSEEGDDRQVFMRIAQEILRGHQQDSAKMRLLLFTALENHRLSHQFFQIYIAGWYELLAAYIRHRIQAGVFRDLDPYLAARSFVGMVIYHILIQELFGGKHFKDFDPQHVSETLTSIWLEGMKVKPGENLTASEVPQDL